MTNYKILKIVLILLIILSTQCIPKITSEKETCSDELESTTDRDVACGSLLVFQSWEDSGRRSQVDEYSISQVERGFYMTLAICASYIQRELDCKKKSGIIPKSGYYDLLGE